MKLGAFAVVYKDLPLEAALDRFAELGLDAVEVGCGGYSRSSHCVPECLLADAKALRAFKRAFDSRGLEISALGCHGNPIHPDGGFASEHHRDFQNTVLLAAELGVSCVGVLSGCPGGAPGDTTPNWAVCPWPEDYLKILEYQWDDVLIPYWRECVAFAEGHGVTRIAMEMHPGFCVYNPETLLRLREAVGPALGVNFDPSHLFWQGIDPAQAILGFGSAIFHMHAKDTAINGPQVQRHGPLDVRHYSLVTQRAWTFRTVGYGHGEDVWRSIISALAAVGYDGVLSIEHEDPLMSREEGLAKAAAFLKPLVIRERPGPMLWA